MYSEQLLFVLLISIIVLSLLFVKNTTIECIIDNSGSNNFLQKMPIFVINLEHRIDRLAHIKKELKKVNLDESSNNLNIIKAINGSLLDLKKLKQNGVLNAYPTKLRAGEVGCYFSHVICWEKIVQTNSPYGMILEDDVILPEYFVTNFNWLFSNVLQFEWDVFLIGRNCVKLHYGEQCKRGIQLNQYFWYPYIAGYGTHSYIIKRDAILKLKKLVYPIRIPIDVLLIELAKNGTIKIISTIEALTTRRDHVGQAIGDSDTQNMNNTDY